MKEAMYYTKMEKDNLVQCFLCPHHCVIAPDRVGLCMVRRNIEGTLNSLNYDTITSIHMDPIEKKPLYHFHPGAWILSLGTLGCNLSCAFCQNSEISQLPKESIDRYFKVMTQPITPEATGELAAKAKDKGSIGIAYTYNEPSIWFEFVLEAAKEVKKRGLANVLVTNGYLEKEPLQELLPFIDAANVDIKSIDDSFYKKLCGARVDPVLEYCKMAKEKVLLEVTNLIITGENDSEESITRLVDWIAENLGKDTPLHFSRYHPDYKFDAPATAAETLAMAYNIASKKLDYVYVGNIWGGGAWENSRCWNCHREVVSRSGFHVNATHLDENKCVFCGTKLNFVGSPVKARL